MIELTSINPSEMKDSEKALLYHELRLTNNCGLDKLLVRVTGEGLVYVGVDKLSKYKF